MSFEPRYLATAIGSMPHTDPSQACNIILNTTPKIPIWPQLPNANFRENMEIQYSEGFPCVVLDEEKQRMYFETNRDITSDFEKFYENYMAENLDYFKISPDYSRGIYEMEKRLAEAGPPYPVYFKTHVTGPITMGLGRVDQNKRAIYYNDVFRDVIVKGTEMKARWMLKKFAFLGSQQMCFVDEPILSAFGSSTYVSLERSAVVRCLREVFKTIHREGALAGAHCCGNTEWTMLIDAGVDIISFDAYEFGKTIGYYPDEMKRFLEGGGVLAWGIVPSSDRITRETPESLVQKLKDCVSNLTDKGIDQDLIWRRCLITPSCGTGSIPLDLSERVIGNLPEVSRLLRDEVTKAA